MYEPCNVTAPWGYFFTRLSFSRLSSFQKLEVFAKLHLLPHLYTCRCPNLKQNLSVILSIFPNITLIDDPFLDFDHFLVRCWFRLCLSFIIFICLDTYLSGATPSAAFCHHPTEAHCQPPFHTHPPPPLPAPSLSHLFPLRFGSYSTCK